MQSDYFRDEKQLIEWYSIRIRRSIVVTITPSYLIRYHDVHRGDFLALPMMRYLEMIALFTTRRKRPLPFNNASRQRGKLLMAGATTKGGGWWWLLLF